MKTSHVRIAPLIDPATPDGLSTAFRHGATECLMGAEALDKSPMPNLTGEYILTFHAIELALKAFLVKHGVTVDQLKSRPYGHNLTSLHAQAAKLGLVLTIPAAKETLAMINQYHDKGALLRYDFVGTRKLPFCDTLFPFVVEILAASK
jgi:hypothetical protein